MQHLSTKNSYLPNGKMVRFLVGFLLLHIVYGVLTIYDHVIRESRTFEAGVRHN